WTAWQDFSASFQVYFLPRGYFEKLEEEVRGRRQRPGEPFKRFMVKMQTLMRPLRYSLEDQLKLIQDRSLPDLRAYARPYNCRSIIELLQVPQMAEPASSRLRQHSPSGGRQAAATDYAKVAKQVREWGVK
ncbi:hypothetical protein KR018_005950, partial [Drosophila ironensis]